MQKVMNKLNYVKKEFDSEPVYNKQFLKTKVKSYGDGVKHFYDKKIPKVHLIMLVYQ